MTCASRPSDHKNRPKPRQALCAIVLMYRNDTVH